MVREGGGGWEDGEGLRGWGQSEPYPVGGDQKSRYRWSHDAVIHDLCS